MWPPGFKNTRLIAKRDIHGSYSALLAFSFCVSLEFSRCFAVHIDPLLAYIEFLFVGSYSACRNNPYFVFPAHIKGHPDDAVA